MSSYSSYHTVYDIVDGAEIEWEAMGMTDEDLDVEVELEIELTVNYMGCPAVMYLPNGDPGYPEEPSEYEVKLERVTIGNELSEDFAEVIRSHAQKFFEFIEDEIADSAFSSYCN